MISHHFLFPNRLFPHPYSRLMISLPSLVKRKSIRRTSADSQHCIDPPADICTHPLGLLTCSVLSSFIPLLSRLFRDNPSETLHSLLRRQNLPSLLDHSHPHKKCCYFSHLKKSFLLTQFTRHKLLFSSATLCRKTPWNFLYLPFLIPPLLCFLLNPLRLVLQVDRCTVLVKVINWWHLNKTHGQLSSHLTH